MTESEWLACDDPDLLLEHLIGKASHAQLVTFARQCWERICEYLPNVPFDTTAVDQFAEIADQQSDHDTAVYASEAALKAARLAPNLRDEQRHQAELLRRIVGNPFRMSSYE